MVYQNYNHDLIAHGFIYEIAFFNSAVGEDASNLYSVLAVFRQSYMLVSAHHLH